MDLARRHFLSRCGQVAGVLLLPSGSQAQTATDYHLHPHYREPRTPSDSTILRIDPALDTFICEKHHARLAPILRTWSSNLQVLPTLAPGFVGGSWKPVSTRAARRATPTITVDRLSFDAEPALSSEAFLQSFRASMAVFQKIMTANFEITAISPTLETRVRYEIVGTGNGFHREQRIGEWTIHWDETYRITRWMSHEETRSRSLRQCFAEITPAAFGANSSYQSQLLQGADHWRTGLDAACGIDIYGHNGVSVGDIDNDGFDDLYICQPAGLPNRLFRNRGDGTFEDITDSSGVGVLENTACALFADFTNNGHQDLLVVRTNGPMLFLNEGGGKFRLKRDAFHFLNAPQGTFTGASAADYNLDGHLDIYFCLYVYYQGAGQYKYPAPYYAAENGPPNFLMRNNGDGTFRDVTEESGLNKNNTRFSFCCGWNDYNNDGHPDLYVVNDFGRKNLYRNNGDGTFTDVAADLGVEDIGAGMSVAWFDYNNDGAEDLYVANMWTAAGERVASDKDFQPAAPDQTRAFYRKHAMGNSLFENRGGLFHNLTASSGTNVGRWSWSSDAWDFDHDGFADIYVSNGMISGPNTEDLNSFFWRQVVAKSPNAAIPALPYDQGWNAINELIREGHTWSGNERNCLFVNNQDGTFSDIAGVLDVDFLEDSRSFALADFDGDGRQEMLLKNRNAPQIRLVKNTIPDLPASIRFQLAGTKSNRDAIGASITVGSQTKRIQAGSGFFSQHSKTLHFGMGDSQDTITASVRWPSGHIQKVSDVPVNHTVKITEGSDTFQHLPFQTLKPPVSSNATLPAEPTNIETWLISPVAAPGIPPGKAQLLTFNEDSPDDDRSAIYNLLFRYIFDHHRDLPLPTSFLIDENAQIVKIDQGSVQLHQMEADLRNIPKTEADRIKKSLPFPGLTSSFTYGRNYLSLGSILFQRGYPEASKVFFEIALKEDPSSAEAYYGLGSVYLGSQDNSRARSCFERAAQLKSTYPETAPNAWNNLGLLATREGNTAQAIGYFQKALEMDQAHFIAMENLGSAYRQQKLWPQARKTLEQALAIKPDDPEANYSLGMVFAQTDDTELAYEYLNKALLARPDYAEALNNLGILYLRTHRRDDAVATFQKCIQLVPRFNQPYMNLARVYAIEGNTDKAILLLRNFLTNNPDDTRVKDTLSQLTQK